MPKPQAILLLAHGTPDVLSEMAPYLAKVTNNRPLPAEVIEELQHRYAEIGLMETPMPEGPPLTRWTLQQGRMLQDVLDLPVYVGMRNWHPYIADVVAKMREDGITSFKAVCLAPQNSRTSVGLYRSVTAAAAAGDPANGKPAMAMEFVAGWHLHPLLALAFAERMWPAWAEACAKHGTRVPVLFTAHSVPCRTVQSGQDRSATSPSAQPGRPVPADGIQNYGPRTTPDTYNRDTKLTAQLIARALAPVGMTDQDWFFAFQSQGVAGGPWIGPTVEDTFKALAESGHKAVVMQPVGFLCDHVEILYDIDIAFRETGRELGLDVTRAQSLNASDTLIQALKTIAEGTYQAEIDEPATPNP